MTLRPYSLAQADETRPGELRALDPDEPTRAEAVKRLLALAEEQPYVWSPWLWLARLRALWAAWRAIWRGRHDA